MSEGGGSTSSSVEAQNRGGGVVDSRLAWIARLPLQHVAVFFASTGTFAAGVVLGWNSFAGYILRTKPHLDSSDANEVVSIVAAGGCIGALLPILALFNCRGARAQLAVAYVLLLFIGWLCVYRADTEYTLAMVGRIFSGIGIGIFLTILPIFIGEIASPRRRDRLLFFAHTTLSCGIAVAYAFANTEAEDLWNYNFDCALVCLPAMLCGAMMYFDPVESLAGGREDEARMALAMYGANDEAYVNKKVEELRELVKKDVELKPRSYYKPAVLLVLTLCQQLSGASMVLFNALLLLDLAKMHATLQYPEIPEKDLPKSPLTFSEQCQVCALSQIIANVLGFLLIGLFGRRAMLFLSGLLMAATMGMLGFILKTPLCLVFPWFAPTILAAYYAAYGLGFGPIIWGMLADSFPVSLRLIGASAVASIGWLTSLLLNMYIDSLTDELTVLFWVFVGFSLIGAFVGVCLVRETRKKSLLDLQRQFING